LTFRTSEKNTRTAIVWPWNGIFLPESPLRREAILVFMRTPGDTHTYQGIPFEELLERAHAGNRGAFEELFKR
jgi:hypothetical protein